MRRADLRQSPKVGVLSQNRACGPRTWLPLDWAYSPRRGIRLSPDIASGSCELLSNTCQVCPQTGRHAILHAYPPDPPNLVRLRYVPLTFYRFLQFGPVGRDPPCDSNSLPCGQGWVCFLPQKLSEPEIPSLGIQKDHLISQVVFYCLAAFHSNTRPPANRFVQVLHHFPSLGISCGEFSPRGSCADAGLSLRSLRGAPSLRHLFLPFSGSRCKSSAAC